MSVLEKLKALDGERAKILKEAKSAALQKAQDAIGELNRLGFHYRLIEQSSPPAASVPPTNEHLQGDAKLTKEGLAKVEVTLSGFDQTLPGS